MDFDELSELTAEEWFVWFGKNLTLLSRQAADRGLDDLQLAIVLVMRIYDRDRDRIRLSTREDSC